MKILLFAFAALVCTVIWIGFLSSQMKDKDAAKGLGVLLGIGTAALLALANVAL